MSRFSMRMILQIVSLLSIVFVATEAHATKSKWFTSYGAGNVSGTVYAQPMGDDGTFGATEATSFCLMPTGGTVRGLRVKASAAPGAAASSNAWTITFRKELGDTALACTILETETTCTDDDEISLIAGDRIAVSILGVSTPDAGNLAFLMEFNSTTAGETVFCSSSGGVAIASAENYISPFAQGNGGVENTRWIVMPSGGTVSKFYFRLVTAPGAGTTTVFTMFQNSTTSGGTVSYGEAETGVKSDTSTTLTISAGDTLSVHHTITGAPATSQAAWGAVFSPTVVGDFVIATSSGINLVNSAVRFLPLSGSTPNATETTVQTIGYTDFTIKAMYAKLGASPGANPNDYTFQLREGAMDASVPFTITILDPNTAGNASGTFTPADGGLLAIESTPNSTPTASPGAISLLGNMPASTGPPLGGFTLLGVGR